MSFKSPMKGPNTMNVHPIRSADDPNICGSFSRPMYLIIMRLLSVMLAAIPHPATPITTPIHMRLVSNGKTVVVERVAVVKVMDIVQLIFVGERELG